MVIPTDDTGTVSAAAPGAVSSVTRPAELIDRDGQIKKGVTKPPSGVSRIFRESYLLVRLRVRHFQPFSVDLGKVSSPGVHDWKFLRISGRAALFGIA